MSIWELLRKFGCVRFVDDPIEGGGTAVADPEPEPEPIPEPDPQPGKDEVKQVRIGDEVYKLDENGNVIDESGVPYFNRLKEHEKKLTKAQERELELRKKLESAPKQQPTAPTRDQILESYRQRYPFMTDDMLQANLEISESMAQAMLSKTLAPYQPVLGGLVENNVRNEVVADKENFPHYSDYKAEIDQLFKEGYPQDVKMNPKAAKEALSNCYNVVIGRHINDIIKKASQSKPEKEIAGMVKGTKTATKPIGADTVTTLNENQLLHAERLGIKPATYADLLKPRIAKAKANGKPTPELISDPVT